MNNDFFNDEMVELPKKDYDKMCELLEGFAKALESQQKENEDLKTQLNTKKVVPVLGKYEVMLKSLNGDSDYVETI